ncbi:phage replisome organizer N-terminal domain-containing protein [Terrisporobacter sp.]
MGKKYFWLKIQESFFAKKEMKILRKMKNGATYVIIYQKMLLAALENQNMLYFDHLEDSFEEELAVLLDEDVADVKATVDFLKKANLIEVENNDEYVLTEMETLTGKESESKHRVKKYREKNKNNKAEKETSLEALYNEEKSLKNNVKDSSNIEVATLLEDNLDDISNKENKQENLSAKVESCNVTCNGEKNLCNVTCNENVTLDIEKEKELELDKELEIDKNKKGQKSKVLSQSKNSQSNNNLNNSQMEFSDLKDENLIKMLKLYEKNIGSIYPADREYLMKISDKINWTLFEKALQICRDKKKLNSAYLKGIINKWSERKICTLEEWRKNEEEFKGHKCVKNESKVFEEIDENMLREIAAMEKELVIS